MSQFNKALDLAKARQHRLYAILSSALVLAILIIAGVFVASKATRIQVLPKDAGDIAAIQVHKGIGVVIGDSAYTMAEKLHLFVSANGFQTKEDIITPTSHGKVKVIELRELPGMLTIETKPSNDKTTWYLGGKAASIGPTFEQKLEPGNYSIEIDNPYFKKERIDLELKRQEEKSLSINLEPITGLIKIGSRPSGVPVFLDKANIGNTPLQLKRTGGSYAIKLISDDFEDITDKIELSRRAPDVVRNYRLERKKALLLIELEPKGGIFLLNGARFDTTSSLKVDSQIAHKLTYKKAGFFQHVETATLSSGEERRISIRLQPEMGDVQISSSPKAEIWIAGKSYGLSPTTLALPAIPHKIIFKKNNYRTVTKPVTPSSRSIQKISARLYTEKSARLNEAAKQYTNNAGIKLKLFLPNDAITLGAARHEKGQRANEFLRLVKLQKPFYAGLHEVSNEQYKRVFPNQNVSGSPNHPVTSLSWVDAALYCNALSLKENLSPFYTITNGKVTGFIEDSGGYRLLSEAEWEWLARKSGKQKQTIFTWGNKTVIPPKAVNIADESSKGSVKYYVPNYTDAFSAVAPIGSFAEEPSGLYDLAGNVSEWVHDVYSIMPPTRGTVKTDPLGTQRGRTHVIKGANWRSGTVTELRPAFREGLVEGRDDLGFRVGRYL
jgi:formylglycine-generating enzyme required for sulfatase activity